MNKTLHLIRHAKSSWQDPDLADIDRPLNKRGKRDIRTMAGPILDKGCDFDNIYCSPAKRTRLTIKGILNTLKMADRQWFIDAELYTFEYRGLLQWCRRLDNNLSSVTIVGHNPALTDLCQYFVPRCGIGNVPTCAYVQLGFAVDSWLDLKNGCGELRCFIKPKDFQQLA